MTAAILQLVFAAAFFGIGRWGRRHAAELVPTSLSAEGQAKKERSLRRGAWSCQIIAVFFVLLGVVGPILSI
ncbi:hypothetical protein [Protofrankia symbiont of Coriaria ruscifolia]|uniref:hypothetical protein n=1 Tax=Protofrankia symbiont of Coriaria ruscifolia TaxID=1306542 RepID=UPI0010419E36|nr:hypothetical protein [Protofrankia symbiont of Coriaria ruscifolia]